MNVELPRIEWKRVYKYSHVPPELTKYLSKLVKRTNFAQNADTTYAYSAVESHLGVDGWERTRRYLRPREGLPFEVRSRDEEGGDDLDRYVGHSVRTLIGGSVYYQEDANELRSWVGEGGWPSNLDMAAFLYYCAFEPL